MDNIDNEGFFSSQQVRKDMHLHKKMAWELGNVTINYKLIRNQNGSFNSYKQLLINTNLKIVSQNIILWLISGRLRAELPPNGDKKPPNGDKQIIDRLKLQINLPTYRLLQSWKYNNKIHVGYAQWLRGLTDATVRSARLYIYGDQPQIGYQLFPRFVTPK